MQLGKGCWIKFRIVLSGSKKSYIDTRTIILLSSELIIGPEVDSVLLMATFTPEKLSGWTIPTQVEFHRNSKCYPQTPRTFLSRRCKVVWNYVVLPLVYTDNSNSLPYHWIQCSDWQSFSLQNYVILLQVCLVYICVYTSVDKFLYIFCIH